ncbi:hypothetical protein FAZ15_03345 [Sphingobacterium olei]|uniref:Uncharacterized protein n=1 Tax=Sphingobacterium olei TaxID=2571155 RepID=A0A4U0P770_9SPHI|nr:hypothetical protein [Sphingobacterium olei]TJZ63327.1 hypothetical protein FAZ15_03345 [Sphingobacterium olei]
MRDSSERHWSFWTDGWLYYHPDSGLLAQGGQLELRESGIRQWQSEDDMLQHVQNSQETTTLQQDEQVELKHKNSFSFWLYVILAFVVILGFSSYRR